jgi:hypothetical protein
MIDEKLVQELAQKYNLVCSIFPGTNKIHIKSKYDEWYVIVNNPSSMLLYHKNKVRNKNYHLQREEPFHDFYFLFKSIKQHDDYQIGQFDKFKTGRTAKLFDLIAQERQNKKKKKNILTI